MLLRSPAMKAAIIAGCVVLSMQCAAPGAHASAWGHQKCFATETYGADTIAFSLKTKPIAYPYVDTIFEADMDKTIQIFKNWTHVYYWDDFRFIQMPCCGQMLCWVNPRLPNYLDRVCRAR